MTTDHNEAMRLAGELVAPIGTQTSYQTAHEAAALIRKQAERIAELEKDGAELFGKVFSLGFELGQVEDERDTLRAEVERLRADAERLDHIEKHARCDPKMDGHHVWWPTSFKHALRGPTLRAAIDAARTTHKEPE